MRFDRCDHADRRVADVGVGCGRQRRATQTVKVLNAVESLQQIAAELQAIIASSTSAPLTARATDAPKKVEKAIANSLLQRLSAVSSMI